MSAIETKILSQSINKPLEWKRYIDDIFSLWDINRQEMEQFIDQVLNRFHPTIKFTAEISKKEATFLDTIIYKGARIYNRNRFLMPLRTQCKPTETFQYTHYSSAPHQALKKLLHACEDHFHLYSFPQFTRMIFILYTSRHSLHITGRNWTHTWPASGEAS